MKFPCAAVASYQLMEVRGVGIYLGCAKMPMKDSGVGRRYPVLQKAGELVSG